MYLEYVTKHKAQELTREAEQHRLARAVRPNGNSPSHRLNFAPVNGFGNILLALGTRLTNSVPARQRTIQPVCVECGA